MDFSKVRDLIAGVPFTSPERGRELYEFVRKEKPVRCLELGFAHGVASCYVAAALEANGVGQLDAVDLRSVERHPSAEELLAKCGLSHRVTLHRENASYTWYLKKKIEAASVQDICRPSLDLCFIDGPKNWTIDGAAFFMVDKLLNLNGTIVFDDYSYAYGDASGHTDGISHRNMGPDEVSQPHIKAVFHLLVMQHPSYGDFQVVNEQWAWARKTGGSDRVLTVYENIGLREKILRLARRLRSKK